ncbi:MAG TPA: 2-C-methyl-D-erythritol 4-phosphate cytidylyltransferase [Tepidisphaeraceae bacterium]|jgi:2-C-methyl-D-erythritol 4-phosphate cytidylyltransferase
MPPFAVIIPAAGASTRYGGAQNKLLESLAGQPVIARTAKAFLDRPDVVHVIVPTALENLCELLPGDPRIITCPGGPTRAHSVRCGLERVPASVEFVAIHDGARPLVSQGLIDRTLAAAVEHGAAVPALPVTLTIKEAAGPLPARVERTVPRDRLWAMQTPQIARRAELIRAFDTCPIPLAEVTDDVQLIELAGGEVWLVEGDERNLKITTPMDLRIAEMLLSNHPGR